jgi:hypothetical protein
VNELRVGGLLSPPGIEAFNMLPCIAGFAVYRISVILGPFAYAFDGILVGVLIYGLGRRKRIVSRD